MAQAYSFLAALAWVPRPCAIRFRNRRAVCRTVRPRIDARWSASGLVAKSRRGRLGLRFGRCVHHAIERLSCRKAVADGAANIWKIATGGRDRLPFAFTSRAAAPVPRPLRPNEDAGGVIDVASCARARRRDDAGFKVRAAYSEIYTVRHPAGVLSVRVDEARNCPPATHEGFASTLPTTRSPGWRSRCGSSGSSASGVGRDGARMAPLAQALNVQIDVNAQEADPPHRDWGQLAARRIRPSGMMGGFAGSSRLSLSSRAVVFR